MDVLTLLTVGRYGIFCQWVIIFLIVYRMKMLNELMDVQVNGTCNTPVLSPPPPAQVSPSGSDGSSMGFSIHKVVKLHSFIGTFLFTWILLFL